MSVTYTTVTTFEPTHCECGVQFALTQSMYRHLKRSQDWFYCPNGCHIHYTGDSVEQQLRRELDTGRKEKRALRYRLDHANRSRAALKGQVAKIKRRISKGVCPCCRRNFANLQEHMAGQHPNWREESSTQKL